MIVENGNIALITCVNGVDIEVAICVEQTEWLKRPGVRKYASSPIKAQTKNV